MSYSSFSSCKETQNFLSFSQFVLCSVKNMFSLGSLCLKVFFSCSVGLHPVNTYVLILFSCHYFSVLVSRFFFLKCVKYTFRNKNSSKLPLDLYILTFCLPFSFSLLWSGMVPIDAGNPQRRKKCIHTIAKDTF